MVIEITNATNSQWYNECIGKKFYAFQLPSFPNCFFISLNFFSNEQGSFELIVHSNDCKVLKNDRN